MIIKNLKEKTNTGNSKFPEITYKGSNEILAQLSNTINTFHQNGLTTNWHSNVYYYTDPVAES